MKFPSVTLQWRHNEHAGVSNHKPHDCLLNRLFMRRLKKTPKLRVTGLCVGNSPVTGEFRPQMASNTENVSIWWRHYGSIVAGCNGGLSHIITCSNKKKYRKTFSKRYIKSPNLVVSRPVLQFSSPNPLIHWIQVLSREWRCSWSSAFE